MDTIEHWIPTAPWRDRAVSLILISSDHTSVRQDHTLHGKREILEASTPADTLLATWHGQRRTDARRIAPQQVSEVLRAIS